MDFSMESKIKQLNNSIDFTTQNQSVLSHFIPSNIPKQNFELKFLVDGSLSSND
jgi:hypothetical protein